MNRELVDKIVNAVLYEGYILYPYRASSKKNQRERFTFGRIYPQEYSDAQNGREPCLMQTECLVSNESHDAALEITVRFLQPLAREVCRPIAPVAGVTDAFAQQKIWLEAIEREVKLSPIPLNEPIARSHAFKFSAAQSMDGAIVRRSEAINGQIGLETHTVDPAMVKISVRIFNETPLPAEMDNQEAVLMRTFASTHTILHAPGGKFVSLLDPDPDCIELAGACRNIGTWPVLVGDKENHEHDTLLSSPIILYDHPQIAPESAGDLFDNTEIDELLTLRVQALTDIEKVEMQRVDEQARKILERAENLRPEQFLKMHGTLREVRKTNEEFFNPAQRRESAAVNGVTLKAGDRVRIRPKRRSDVMDIALEGKIAIIEAVEEDVDKNVHFAVVLEDDPGKDIGMMRHIGHRFFYGADEVEPLIER
jgi:hydrogenase maturation protease